MVAKYKPENFRPAVLFAIRAVLPRHSADAISDLCETQLGTKHTVTVSSYIRGESYSKCQ